MTKKIKNIPLSGISTTPDDFNCEDGSLSAALNVVADGGVLRNAVHQRPKVIKDYGTDTVVYKHVGHNFANYIVRRADGSFYADILAIQCQINITSALRFEYLVHNVNNDEWEWNGSSLNVNDSIKRSPGLLDEKHRIRVIPSITIANPSEESIQADKTIIETYFNGEKVYDGNDYILLNHGVGLYHFVIKVSVIGHIYTYVCGQGIGSYGVAAQFDAIPTGVMDRSGRYYDRAVMMTVYSGGDETATEILDYYKDEYVLSAERDSEDENLIHYTAQYIFLKDTGEKQAYSGYTVTEQMTTGEVTGTARIPAGSESGQIEIWIDKSLEQQDESDSANYPEEQVLVGKIEYSSQIDGVTVQYSGLDEVDATEFPATFFYNRSFPEVDGMTDAKILSMKNLILFHNGEANHWYTLDEKNNIYKYLGHKIPFPKLQFYLEGHYYSNNTYKDFENGNYTANPTRLKVGAIDPYLGSLNGNAATAQDAVFSQDLDTMSQFEPNEQGLISSNEAAAVQAVNAECNKFVANINQLGGFSQPFFVVYALRLKDGSIYQASAPVLINGRLRNNPLITAQYRSKSPRNVWLNAHGFFGYLKLRMLEDWQFSDWTDFIESIDIFVSNPIYTYKQDADKIGDYLITYDDNPSDLVGKPVWPTTTPFMSEGESRGNESFLTHKGIDVVSGEVESVNGGSPLLHYDVYAEFGPHEYNLAAKITGSSDGQPDLYTNKYRLCSPWCNLFHVDPVYRTDSEMWKEFKATSTFYLVKSIKPQSLNFYGEDLTIDIDEDTLASLSAGEAVSFPYDVEADIRFNVSRVYNSRLNIADITKRYQANGSLSVMAEREDGEAEWLLAITMSNGSCIVYRDTGTRRVSPPTWIAYNEPDVETFELYRLYRGVVLLYRYDASAYELLNMSYCNTEEQDVQGLRTDYTSLDDVEAAKSVSVVKRLTNEIRTSEINNPFLFKAANIEYVGNGEIYALCPNTAALSEGQSGQHPMYAFSSDGIFALSVSQSGGWASSHVVSRDILMNGDSENVLQLDDAVLFSALRGLMLIQGSRSEYISQAFHDATSQWSIRIAANSQPDALQWLFDGIIGRVSSIADEREDINATNAFPPDFERTFIANAVYLYDYRHQRIIVGNPDYPTSFVYSLDSKMWTSMHQRILNAVNSYPQCEAVTQAPDGSHLLVDFADDSNEDAYVPSDGFILTRPIKLGDSTALKTIRTINVQGQFSRSHVDIVLFGSSDNKMQNWVILASARGSRLAFRYGTPFKAFRVALLTHLEADESISSITIEYEVKEQNKLRQ